VPSSESLRAAGWRCAEVGTWAELRREAAELPAAEGHEAEPQENQFRWGLFHMREARDEKLAVLRDPSNAQREAWLRHLYGSARPDLTLTAPGGEEVSFLVLGDPGEGDASQFAVVPPLRSVAEGASFLFVASDVIYPAGDVNDYRRKVFLPYQRLGIPVYAIPGNHDWDDGALFGFMYHFCRQESVPAEVYEAVPPLLRRFWRKPSSPRPETAAARAEAIAAGMLVEQPGPYFALEAGPLLLVGIDLGFCAVMDRPQGEWLARVSAASSRPKILVASKPIYSEGRYTPIAIEGGGTVDEIVRRPDSNYVAVLSGEIHNYQRYPVAVEGGRTIQYVVNGGGGAFTQGTHTVPRIRIPNANPGLPPVDEADVRLYPLRGDSLAFFSLLYARRIGDMVRRGGLRGRAIARVLRAAGFSSPDDLRIPPEQADALMGELRGIAPERGGETDAPTALTRRAASFVRWLPAGQLGEMYYPYWDWDEPPFFKSFLRFDARPDELRVRCFAATGCAEHEADPPVEDEFVIPL
jgi:hypothetical protein